jgi:hypothetical protein
VSAELTPVMDEEQREESRRLSLQDLRPPLRVPGYEDEKFIGRGAFGEVWSARDRNSGRHVAIKFYNRRGGLDWSLLVREVEKLRHLFTDRHVVQLLAVGWDADPPYYVMEYMEHGSLEDRLRDGPLPVEQALPLWEEIALGLIHAHGRGILHCDLKPANVLLDEDHRPRLADFGQARLTNESSPALGTLFYMAPEQADLKAVPDARWDVYALGALLYCMLTGSPPYRTAEAVQIIHDAGNLEQRLEQYRQLLRNSPRPTAHRDVPGVDAALADIIDRCLTLQPRDRYPNVQTVLNALQSRALKRARRPLLVLGAAAPALVLFVMAAAGGWLFDSAVRTSRAALTERALESDRFAAQSVARQVALEVDRRWQILEKEAADPALPRWLEQIRTLPPDSPQRGEVSARLSGWLDDRLTRHNRHFDEKTPARSWFVNDVHGVQLARSPHDPGTVGANWAHRDYFHGRGVEYDLNALPEPRPGPLHRPHASLVYRSAASGRLSVAFSVPVWGGPPGEGEPVGVLALSADLGRLAHLEGSRGQFPVLVESRPGPRQGLVLEHPALDPEAGLPVGGSLDNPKAGSKDAGVDYHASPEVVRRAIQIREGGQSGSLFDFPGDYEDPVLGPSAGRWLATLEPIVVHRGPSESFDTGWIVLVQERSADTLRPLDALSAKLFTGSILALVAAVVVVTALWGLVLFVLEAPSGSWLARFLRRRAGLPSGSGGSGSSGPASGSGGKKP